MTIMRRKPATPGGRRPPGATIRFYVTLALLAWALRSLVVAPFSIPSGSMLPNMWIGDYLFVAKWPYGYSRNSFPFGFPPISGRVPPGLPERGDIVVFKRPGETTDWVKRVIGLPGDIVAVRGGRLIINGETVEREDAGWFISPISPNSPCRVAPGATPDPIATTTGPACRYPAYRERLPGGRSWIVLDQVDQPGDEFGPVRVPRGQLFLMGDNRDDSLDSRYTPAAGGVGFVPVENLVGRAGIAFWSTDGSASYWQPWTWFTALRTDRLGEDYQQ